MKNLILIIGLITFTISLQAQTFSTNETPVGMEHNVLFNAEKRFKVTQTGGAALVFYKLFDGKFEPSYTATAPTVDDPTVILIENLPEIHTQLGAWVGWSTRYWPTNRFKIEAYNVYETEEWLVVADYSNNDYEAKANYNIKLPRGRYTKLRYTFYSATGTDGRLGISELFFIHPEAVSPYEGLFTGGGSVTNGLWEKNTEGISYTGGNVGIGTTTPTERLDVKGLIKIEKANNKDNNSPGITLINNDDFLYDGEYLNHYGIGFHEYQDGTTSYKSPLSAYISGFYGIDFFTGSGNRMRISSNGNIGIGTTDTKGYKLAVAGKVIAEEVKVELQTNWPDYVFEDDYDLPSLEETENFIKENGRLQNIPNAAEVAEEGISLGEMNAKLLQKIEELTLYTIQQQKAIETQANEIQELKKSFTKK